MTELSKQIQLLRSQGKTYNEIKQELNCSKGTICYYLGIGQKQKNNNRQNKNRLKKHPFIAKFQYFTYRKKHKKPNQVSTSNTLQLLGAKIRNFNLDCNSKNKRNYRMYKDSQFSPQDVIKKFGDNTVCYLTGQKIDINQPRTYHFDHIIPSSRGGDNSLENLGICTKQVNASKSDMTPDEFINLCKIVLEHNGYSITKS